MLDSIINRTIISIIPYLPISFIRMFAGRYVAGETASQALKIVRELNKKGYDKYVKNKRRDSKKGVKPTT